MKAHFVTAFTIDAARRVAVVRQQDGSYRALEERISTHGRWRGQVHGWSYDTPDADEAREAAVYRATEQRVNVSKPTRAGRSRDDENEMSN